MGCVLKRLCATPDTCARLCAPADDGALAEVSKDGSMEDHAYIGELLAGIVYLIAGVRLFWLGQRTGEVPEKLLGVAFLFTC